MSELECWQSFRKDNERHYARAAVFGHPDAIAALRSSWIKWLRMAHGPVAFAAYTVAERIASLDAQMGKEMEKYSGQATLQDRFVTMMLGEGPPPAVAPKTPAKPAPKAPAKPS